jgi:ribosomal protein L29
MSDTSAFGFGQFVPGFDFLQNLSKTAAQAQPSAAAGMPGMASWVAPTLSIEDIDKRIQELKSVLFWLEQNTTALKATIQAMEVQKMTLTTLQSMNVNMADLAKAFTAKAPTAQPQAAAPPPFAPKAAPEPEPARPEPVQSEPPSSEASSAKPAVDPMQWWGALTQQFQNIAAAAVKDVAAEAMKTGMTAKGARTAAGRQKSPATLKPSSVKTKPAAKSTARKAVARRKTP